MTLSARAIEGEQLLEIRPAWRSDRLLALGVGLFLAFAALVLFFHHPSSLSFMPSCPTKTLLGVDCPGCGSTRAVHHLLHLRIAEAWQLNPALILLGLPVLGLLTVDLTATLLLRKRFILAPRRQFGITLAVMLVVYMVGRNLI